MRVVSLAVVGAAVAGATGMVEREAAVIGGGGAVDSGKSSSFLLIEVWNRLDNVFQLRRRSQR